jgi:hypothetical protein
LGLAGGGVVRYRRAAILSYEDRSYTVVVVAVVVVTLCGLN